MSKPFEMKRYYTWTLDPIHVGTGGYRLGRVDNTITREPGTFVPKLPGSSIAGVTRAYAAMAVQSGVDSNKIIEKKTEGLVLDAEEYRKMKYQRPVYKYANFEKNILAPDIQGDPIIERDSEGRERYLSCAGKGANDGDGHCGEHDCEVCVSFGFSKKNSSFQGLAQFYDARILFFPVHTMIGPAWITAPSILASLQPAADVNVCVNENCFKAVNLDYKTRLNFGWLMLSPDQPSKADVDLSFLKAPATSDLIAKRAFVVPDKLFSQIVNDNLEVRTSVAIDPATGAAEDGALFTYEAIPRATLMWFDVVYNNPDFYRINGKGINKDHKNPADTAWIIDNVEKGFEYFENLGIGGMSTRGMGRLKVLK